MHPQNEEAILDTKYRNMVIVWFGLFFSIVVLFIFGAITAPDEKMIRNNVLTLSFFFLGTLAVIASFIVKQRFLAQSIDKQNVGLVQTGMIVAAALTEVAAMLAVMDRLLTGNRYFYVLIIIAIIGSLLNFPRRDRILSASYKDRLG